MGRPVGGERGGGRGGAGRAAGRGSAPAAVAAVAATVVGGGRGTLVQATVAVRHPRLAAAAPGAAGRSASFPGRNGTPGFAGPARKVCSGAATSRPARPSMKRR